MSWAVGFTFAAVFAALCAAPGRSRLRAALAVPEEGGGRGARTRLRRWRSFILPASAVVLGAVVAGWSVGVGAGLVVACAGWVLSRHRARRAAAVASAEVVRSCQLLAGLLRVGLVPASALRAAADEAPLLAEAAATAGLGGDVAETLRRCGRIAGCAGLGEVANAWEVAELTGASMTSSLEAVVARLAGDAEVRRVVAAELSAPRATGRMLAVLPLAGLGIGYALGGDPGSFLTGSMAGQLTLVLGVALGCAGVVWTDVLADQHGGSR